MKFNINDEVVVFTSVYFNTINGPFSLVDSIIFNQYKIFEYINDIKSLYVRNIFKIKQIESDYVILEPTFIINSKKEYKFMQKDYKYFYTIEQVEAQIKKTYDQFVVPYMQIVNKAQELKMLGADIINIAKSNGINDIASSEISNSINNLREIVENIGWNSSSLSC